MRVYGHLRARRTRASRRRAVAAWVRGRRGAGRDAATAAILKRAVDADAGDLECRIEYGDALLAAGEYVKALEAFETAAKLARREKSLTGGSTAALLNNCAALRAMAGRATGEPGSSDSAKETFLAALEAAARADEKAPETAKSGADLDASSAARRKAPAAALPVAFNLARLAEERGEDAEADARYDDLLAAAPGMTECLLRRAGMRARREDFDAAMALAEKAIESKPDDPDAMAYAGHLLMRQEKWKEATAMFKRLRALPKKLDAQAAQLAAAAGKDPEAATHQHDEYAMVSLANAAYYQAVKLQSSAKAFKHAPGMDKNAAKENDKEKAKLRAVEKEHLDHAATMYTKALQKSESNLFAANGLGILLADKGKVDEAKATFQLVAEGITAATADGAKAGDEGVADAAAQRLASSPDIWINQGHVQMAKGNYVAAASFPALSLSTVCSCANRFRASSKSAIAPSTCFNLPSTTPPPLRLDLSRPSNVRLSTRLAFSCNTYARLTRRRWFHGATCKALRRNDLASASWFASYAFLAWYSITRWSRL